MAERNPSRPWSDEEDLLLTNAVQIHGEHENWKNVASLVPGRTNKACRKRWLHSLSPTIKKSAWTSAEDDLLVSLYKIHGTKWSAIARGIPGRTDDACSKRYREALDPALKKDEWTPDEDKRLMEMFAEIGGKWSQLGQELQRSGLGCRNRHRLLTKRSTKVFYDPIPSELPEIFEVQPLPVASQTCLWTAPLYPYYPPEAYPSFPHEESFALGESFSAPTSEVPAITPDTAPFKFSSSSLSAALSVIPQASDPLPTVYEGPERISPSQSDEHTSAYGNPADQTPLDDFAFPVPRHSSDLSKLFLGVHFDDNGVFQYPEGEHVVSIEQAPGIEASQHWSPIMPSPASAYDQLGADTISSTLSTPYSFSLPLSVSDCSTPKSSSPVDLPTNEHLSTFSPNRRSQRMRSRKGTKIDISEKPLRLSSSLISTTDPSIRPYACGRESCWPSGESSGSSYFSTSKDLLAHTKKIHAADGPGDKPFRCALAGCGKSWKNLNGLQYHLQLSTAHYRTALSSKFSQGQGGDILRGATSATSAPESDGDAESGEEDNPREYVCRHPHCFKAYRQASGLRYHLKHGHPQEQPAQLSTVPPALARQLPSKTRKMRRKGST